MNAGRMARNVASIVNRPTCGGVKKAGLAPTVGWYLSSNPNLIGATNTLLGANSICRGNFSNPSQSALRAIRRY